MCSSDLVLLEVLEQGDDGNHGEHGARGEQAQVVGPVAGQQAVQAHGQRLLGIVGQEDRAQEEVADNADEGQQEGRGQDRLERGQQDDAEDLPVGAPVDNGGLVELPGDRVERALNEPSSSALSR